MGKEVRTGRVQIYTGEGKGKTTAAFGLAMRAVGCGLSVVIIQFQKARRCGEHVSAEKLGIYLSHCPRGRGFHSCERPCPLLAEARAAFAEGADVVVLDEIMAAMRNGCVELEEALSLIDGRPAETELVMTGRGVPDELTARADLITEMKKIRHYYDAGLSAREGIEY